MQDLNILDPFLKNVLKNGNLGIIFLFFFYMSLRGPNLPIVIEGACSVSDSSVVTSIMIDLLRNLVILS